MKNKISLYICIIISVFIVATASAYASVNIDLSSNEQLIQEYIDAVKSSENVNADNVATENAGADNPNQDNAGANNCDILFKTLKENNDNFKNIQNPELTTFFESGTIENMYKYNIFNEENLKTIYKITTGKDIDVNNATEESKSGTLIYILCIGVLLVLLIFAVVIIKTINKRLREEKKKSKTKVTASKNTQKKTEREIYELESLYKIEYEKKDKELKHITETLKQKDLEISNLKELVYEYEHKLKLMQNKNDREKSYDNTVFSQREIDEINKTTSVSRKTKKKFNNTIDMYNEYINTNEDIELKKVSTKVNDGYIDICKGDMVYMENTGHNEISIYPKNNILNAVIRDTLAIYFQYDVHGDTTIKVQKPCVLTNTSYGYKIVEKGLVIIS